MLHLLKEATQNLYGHLCKSELNKDACLRGKSRNKNMAINPNVRIVVSSLGREVHVKEGA